MSLKIREGFIVDELEEEEEEDPEERRRRKAREKQRRREKRAREEGLDEEDLDLIEEANPDLERRLRSEVCYRIKLLKYCCNNP